MNNVEIVKGVYEAFGRGDVPYPQVCHVWTLRHGKLARFQQYVDTAQLQDVMGARLSA